MKRGRSWLSLFLVWILLTGLEVSATQAEEQQIPSSTSQPSKKTRKRERTADTAVTEYNSDLTAHTENMRKIQAGGSHDLLFIGDETTHDWSHYGKKSWANFAKYKPLDLAIEGACTEDVLWQISHGELDTLSPKVTVILIGTNNLSHPEEKPEWTAAGIEKVVQSVHDKLPETQIILLAVFPRGSIQAKTGKRIEAVNALIAKANFNEKTTYLDINAKFLDDKGNTPRDLMEGNRIPTEKGYGVWYDGMLPTLSSLIK